MYIPGRFRTASSPSRTLMFSAPYSGTLACPLLIDTHVESRTRNYTAGSLEVPHSSRRSERSESHRHQNVCEGRVLRAVEDSGSHLVRETEFHDVTSGVHAEHVEQVACIEADRQRLAGIRHLDFFTRLALLGVARSDLEHSLLKAEFHTMRTLTREQRHPPKGTEEVLAVHPDLRPRASRNDLLIVRKFTLDEAHEKGDLRRLHAHVLFRNHQRQLDLFPLLQELSDLDEPLSRHDHAFREPG